jgi:hypothetical protein
MAISQEEHNLIEEILEELKVQKYTINDDGTVDVDGDVLIGGMGLKEIPLQFGKVTDTFNCSSNRIVSLDGAPREVGGDFLCYDNKLTSLESSPIEVDGEFNCAYNKLSSLKGASKKVGGRFFCSYNKLTSLEGSPKQVGDIFYCHDNDLETDPIIELKDLGVTVKKQIISDFS